MSERILRWESTQRYYAARQERDLLGDLVVSFAWGGRHNNKGHLETVPVSTEDEAAQLIADAHARRTQHNYNLVFDTEQ